MSKLIESLLSQNGLGEEEISSFKEFLRSNKTALKKFIQLHDMYRADGNLNSKDADELTADLMTLFKGTAVSTLGTAKWEPNKLAFSLFLDQIGEQPLADFLGIDSVADIPNADLETRADEIRDKNIKEPEEAPRPQLSSRRRTPRSIMAEGLNGGYGRNFLMAHNAALRAKKTK